MLTASSQSLGNTGMVIKVTGRDKVVSNLNIKANVGAKNF